MLDYYNPLINVDMFCAVM